MPELTLSKQLPKFLLLSLALILFFTSNRALGDTDLNLGVKKSYFDKIINKATIIEGSKTFVGVDDGLSNTIYIDKYNNQFLIKEGTDGYLIFGKVALSATHFDKTSVIILYAFISGCSNKWTISQISTWLPEIVEQADSDGFKDEQGLLVTASLGRNLSDNDNAILITVEPSGTYLEEIKQKAKDKKDTKEALALLAKLKLEVAKAEKERLVEEKAEKARLVKEAAEAEKAEKKRIEEEKKLAEQKQKEEQLAKTLGFRAKDLYSSISSFGFKLTTTTKDPATKIKRYNYSKGANLIIIEEDENVLAKEFYAVIDNDTKPFEFLNSILSKLTFTWNITDVTQLLSAVQTNVKNRNDFSYQIKNLSLAVSFTDSTTIIKITPIYPALTKSVEETLWPRIDTSPTSAPAVILPKVEVTVTPGSLPTSEPTTQSVVTIKEANSLPTSIAAQPEPDLPKSTPTFSKEASSGLSLAAPETKKEPEEKERTLKHPWLVFGTGTAVVLGSATALFLLIPVPPPQTGLGNFTIP
jgi:hypothetical protein